MGGSHSHDILNIVCKIRQICGRQDTHTFDRGLETSYSGGNETRIRDSYASRERKHRMGDSNVLYVSESWED